MFSFFKKKKSEPLTIDKIDYLLDYNIVRPYKQKYFITMVTMSNSVVRDIAILKRINKIEKNVERIPPVLISTITNTDTNFSDWFTVNNNFIVKEDILKYWNGFLNEFKTLVEDYEIGMDMERNSIYRSNSILLQPYIINITQTVNKLYDVCAEK